uniref:Uncharacterized protein n=1 Tax=uncultured marine virus TaxID=186617 RepID=A0A0F7L783_9VIRU|nr:hypothetical protein [uncultured marine virus]
MKPRRDRRCQSGFLLFLLSSGSVLTALTTIPSGVGSGNRCCHETGVGWSGYFSLILSARAMATSIASP